MIPPQIVILGAPEDWVNQQLAAALQDRGAGFFFSSASRLTARLGDRQEVYSGGKSLTELDLLLVRHIPGGSLEQIIYRMDALHQLEDSGVRIVNKPKTIEKMVDKYYTSFLLANAGLPTPQTIVVEDRQEALAAFTELGGDVVLKPLFGSRGRGMERLTNPDEAARVFETFEVGGYLYYLQRFIPHNNRDYRQLVIGERLIGAMERHSTGWKCNLSQGGQARRWNPSAEMIDLGLRVASVLETDYCGIDLMQGEDGTVYVIEANSMPGWAGLQKVCDTDIAAALADYLLAQI